MTISVLISGRGSNLLAINEACQRGDLNAHVSHVICNNGDALGLQYAKQHGIKSSLLDHRQFPNRRDFDSTLCQVIEEQNPKLILLAGFMLRLGGTFTRHFEGRLLNIHPSLLPRHIGLNTHEKALRAMDRWHGCSVHFVTEVLDSGPVIARSMVKTQRGDSPETLAARVLEREHHLYWRTAQMVLSGLIKWRDGHVDYCDKRLAYPLIL